jgi:ribose transport system substrate-binding protein
MSEQRCRRGMTRRDVVRTSVIAGAGITLAGVGTFWLPERRAAARQDGNYTIAFIQGVIGDNFYITMDCGARARAEALGATIETQGPEKFDQTLQTPILNAVVQSGPDAIMMAPNDSQGMIAPIQAALDAGIPVFCVDTTINSDIQLADVSTDNVEGGRLAARGLAEAIGEQGKVFVINVTPGISTTDQRQQGFEEEIANYPEIEYLGSEYSNNDANRAAEIATARLQSDPDLAGIFGTNLFSAQGGAAGIRQAGKQGVVKMVGFDAGPTQVEDLRSEVVDILIAQHPGEIGETAVQLIVDYLSTGQAPEPKQVVTGATIVTRDNIEDPEVARYLYVADCSEYEGGDATPAAGATPTA